MSRRTLIALALLAATPLLSAQTPNRQWQQAASLPPGTALQLRLNDQPYPVDCSLVWIDLNAVACETHTYPPQRITYPATAIAFIRSQPPRTAYHEDTGSHSHAFLIGLTAGALFGGLAGSHTDTGTGFAYAAIGGLIGGLIGASVSLNSPYPPHPYVRIPLRTPHLPFRR